MLSPHEIAALMVLNDAEGHMNSTPPTLVPLSSASWSVSKLGHQTTDRSA